MFSNVRECLQMFANDVLKCSQATVSLRRLKKFLFQEDLQEYVVRDAAMGEEAKTMYLQILRLLTTEHNVSLIGVYFLKIIFFLLKFIY